MTTEAEARMKWCPMTRFNGDFTNHLDDRNAMCIASDCMAWRPVFILEVKQDKAVRADQGYCGLGGKP